MSWKSKLISLKSNRERSIYFIDTYLKFSNILVFFFFVWQFLRSIFSDRFTATTKTLLENHSSSQSDNVYQNKLIFVSVKIEKILRIYIDVF